MPLSWSADPAAPCLCGLINITAGVEGAVVPVATVAGVAWVAVAAKAVPAGGGASVFYAFYEVCVSAVAYGAGAIYA